MSRWQIYEVVTDADGVDCYIKRGEIVHCRECRYWHSGECWGIPYRGDYDTSIDTKADDFCSYGSRSEKPNNCEHITEDGVTCAKYPACDDCLDNPLNKIKGSERLVKG